MLVSVFNNFSRHSKILTRTLFLTAALSGMSQVAMADSAVEQLSDCLEKATTTTDKTTVLQWTFVALSAHPDLQSFSHVSAEQKDQLDQKLAQVLQRVIVEQCAAQTKAVIKSDGVQAVAESFQELGQSAGEEIIKNPAVKQQLQGTLRYIDLNKLVMTFLTPDIWSKLGVIR